MLQITKTTGNAEWYTPVIWLDMVREVLGAIDLDPASCELANRRVKATRYFDRASDGLKQEWAGRVFLNPPYARYTIDKFVRKLLYHWHSSDIESYIILANAAVDTQWAQSLMMYSDRICFVRGRISFDKPGGSTIGKPPLGQMFCYAGENADDFDRVFAQAGIIAGTD